MALARERAPWLYGQFGSRLLVTFCIPRYNIPVNQRLSVASVIALALTTHTACRPGNCAPTEDYLGSPDELVALAGATVAQRMRNTHGTGVSIRQITLILHRFGFTTITLDVRADSSSVNPAAGELLGQSSVTLPANEALAETSFAFAPVSRPGVEADASYIIIVHGDPNVALGVGGDTTLLDPIMAQDSNGVWSPASDNHLSIKVNYGLPCQ